MNNGILPITYQPPPLPYGLLGRPSQVPMPDQRVYAALRTGLVAYWPLNESAETGDVTAVDWTGRGNDLVSNNSVPSVAARVGNGREFTAANAEFLEAAGNNVDLRFADGRDWTIAGWIWIPAFTGNTFPMGRDNTSNREILLELGSGSSLRCNFGPGTANGVAVLVSGLAINTWHFFAFTYTAGSRVLTARANSGIGSANSASAVRPAGAIATSVNPFRLGCRPWPGNEGFFTGRLDEVAKWDRVLTAAELDTLWNSGNGIDLRQ